MSKTLLQIQLSGTLLTEYGPDGSSFIEHWTASVNLRLDDILQSPANPESFAQILSIASQLIPQIGKTPLIQSED